MSTSRRSIQHDETIHVMESSYQQNQLDATLANIQTAIETAREANRLVVPALAASADQCDLDMLQKQSETRALLLLQTTERARELRELRDEIGALKATKAVWKQEKQAVKAENTSIQNSVLGEHQLVIARYRNILQHLDLGMRLQAADAATKGLWKVEFSYKSNLMILEYDEPADTFELLKLTPKLSIFEQLRNFVQNTNDVKSLLCAWRNFCEKLSPNEETAAAAK